MERLMAVSKMLNRVAASCHIHSFINNCINYGFNVRCASRDQQFPHENDMWPELSRSNVRNMTVRCPLKSRISTSTSSKKAMHIFQSIQERPTIFRRWISSLLAKDHTSSDTFSSFGQLNVMALPPVNIVTPFSQCCAN
jgi:hypothetical protein